MYIGIKNCMAAIEIKSENKIIHTENQHFIAIFRYANITQFLHSAYPTISSDLF